MTTCRIRGALVAFLVLGLGCATGSLNWTPSQTSKATGIKDMVMSAAPNTPVRQMIAAAGVPALRASLYLPAIVKDPKPMPAHLRRVELYGYVTGPTEITRVAVSNGVIVARDAITLPQVAYAEQGPKVPPPRTWALPSGIGADELMRRYGQPVHRQWEGAAEMLIYGGDDNVAIALVEKDLVTRAVSLRAHPAAGKRPEILMAQLAGFIAPNEQMERMLADVEKTVRTDEFERVRRRD